MVERCKAQVHDGGKAPTFHQCTRRSVEDGYCRTHHPSAAKAREEAARRRFDEKFEKSIYGRAARLSAEVQAWRERFPQYRYRPQDDCIELAKEQQG